MTTPLTKNNLNPLGVFFQRDVYNNEAYPFDVVAQPFDLWEDRPYHGKKDVKGNIIQIKNTSLKIIGEENSIRSVNFLADAYREFRAEINRRNSRGKINIENSFMNDLEPKKGFVSASFQYEEYVSILLQSFNTFLIKNKMLTKMLNFNDFIKIFHKFLDVLKSLKLPLTYSGFIVSNLCNPSCGGLYFDISEDPYDLDEKKYNDWLTDKNFKIYTELLEKYGMKTDKNIPWRIIADVRSPYMKPYIERYVSNFTLDRVFEVLYDRGYWEDYTKLQETLYRIYISILVSQPTVEIIDKCGKTVQKRKKITLEQVKNISPFVWMSLYLRARLNEANKELPEVRYQILLNETVEISKNLGIKKGIQHINQNVFHFNG